LLAWLWHDSGRVGDVIWSEVPTQFRRLLRFRAGPVYPSAVAVEFWAGLMVIGGITAQLVDLEPQTRRTLVEGPFYVLLVVAAIWAGLAAMTLTRWRR
jgi:hypothetical protein